MYSSSFFTKKSPNCDSNNFSVGNIYFAPFQKFSPEHQISKFHFKMLLHRFRYFLLSTTKSVTFILKSTLSVKTAEDYIHISQRKTWDCVCNVSIVYLNNGKIFLTTYFSICVIYVHIYIYIYFTHFFRFLNSLSTLLNISLD